MSQLASVVFRCFCLKLRQIFSQPFRNKNRGVKDRPSNVAILFLKSPRAHL